MKFVAMDIETVKDFPEGEDWRDHRPLGVACVALWNGIGEVFYGHTADDGIADKMTVSELQDAVERIRDLEREGHRVVTWNGLGFDFPVLAEESDLHEVVKAMALRSVDMMFHLHCVKGYPLALKTAAEGNGTVQKMDGMDGKKALEMWADPGLREAVLSYCGQDAFSTWDLARHTAQQGFLRWISRSGRPQILDLPDGWLPARDAMALPLPDTSWMSSPIPREQFTEWLEA